MPKRPVLPDWLTITFRRRRQVDQPGPAGPRSGPTGDAFSGPRSTPSTTPVPSTAAASSTAASAAGPHVPDHGDRSRRARLRALLSWRRVRRLTVAGTVGGVVAVVVALGCAHWVQSSADGHIYDVASVPAAPVALVLGAQVNDDGQPSAFLAARLEIARRLLEAGKVKAILVSGDHGQWTYDEPGAMQSWLVARGVPADRVVLDHAGFDTYDSCVRASKIFGVHQAIVVTQAFHLPRAVTLCREHGIDATGVGDDSVRIYEAMWLRGEVREYGAAVKAAADVLTSRDPIFLGPHETGVEEAVRRG